MTSKEDNDSLSMEEKLKLNPKYGQKRGPKKNRRNKNKQNGKFHFDTIHGMELDSIPCTVPPAADRDAMEKAFNQNKKDDPRSLFLKGLAKNHKEKLIENCAMTEAEIEFMAETGKAPDTYNVHHKKPIFFGGTNDPSNLILIPHYPHEQLEQGILDPQKMHKQEGETYTITIPQTNDVIYDPKKYGCMKDGQFIEFNSRVDETKYARCWLPEHIEEKRASQNAKKNTNSSAVSQPGSGTLGFLDDIKNNKAPSPCLSPRRHRPPPHNHCRFVFAMSFSS